MEPASRTDGDPGRRPGRRRSGASRQAILDAALEMVRRDGARALCVERVARRAGVGKQTIYRWWPSVGAVVLDALLAAAARELPLPDEGSLAADLESFLAATFRAITRKDGHGPVLRALMAEAQIDPAFAEVFRDRFIAARRQALDALLARAEARGELAPGVARELLIDLAFGVLWYRLLVGHAALTPALARQLAQAVEAAASTRPARRVGALPARAAPPRRERARGYRS